MSREYFQIVPRGGPEKPFSAPPTSREPSAEQLAARAFTEGEWMVPVELVLKCSSSAFVSVVRARHAKREGPKPLARVILRGDRFFAVIFFAEKSDLFLPLDCWTMGAPK